MVSTKVVMKGRSGVKRNGQMASHLTLRVTTSPSNYDNTSGQQAVADPRSGDLEQLPGLTGGSHHYNTLNFQ
uniref:Uncharacterized protein n=1 Tax=Oryza barthii TaxID=65489 RepID=A0A0D3HF31_9ORYZ